MYFNYDGVTYKPFAAGPDLVQEPYKSAQIFFNNQARTIELSAKYLRQIPQHRAQDRIGDEGLGARVAGYAFAAKTNDILHTGSANFSRYDQATVRVNLWTAADSSGYAAAGSNWLTNATIKIHARNWQLNKTSIARLFLTIPYILTTFNHAGYDGYQVRCVSAFYLLPLLVRVRLLLDFQLFLVGYCLKYESNTVDILLQYLKFHFLFAFFLIRMDDDDADRWSKENIERFLDEVSIAIELSLKEQKESEEKRQKEAERRQKDAIADAWQAEIRRNYSDALLLFPVHK
jgi:hypothetical protein